MKTNHFAIKLISILLLSTTFQFLKSQSITVSGNGNLWTASPNTITEAGDNYSNPINSASNQILIAANLNLLFPNAKVTARYVPTTWNNSFVLKIKTTGPGNSGLCLLCTVTPSSADFITLGTSDVEVFRLKGTASLGSFTDIPLQLQLSGISVTIPVATYQNRIVFTISNL